VRQVEPVTAKGRCGWLTAATAGLWLLLAGPAYFVAGTAGLEGLSIAALLCLIPGWIVLFLEAYVAGGNSPSLLILSGTVLRLLFVLVGTLVMQSVHQHLQFREFTAWLLVFYLATLLVETLLVLKQVQPPVQAGSSHVDKL